MSCVIYKGSEKLLIDPVALKGMLAQGWSLQPQKIEQPSVKEFEEFLNLHEELKRVSDEALTARDNQIAELVLQNEQLTEDIEVLEAENIEIRDAMVAALDELKAFKEQAPKIKPDISDANEKAGSVEKPEDSVKTVQSHFEEMTILQLYDAAKKAGIKNSKIYKKQELIRMLSDGSESQD